MFERTDEERKRSEKAGNIFVIIVFVLAIAMTLASQIWWIATVTVLVGGYAIRICVRELRAGPRPK